MHMTLPPTGRVQILTCGTISRSAMYTACLFSAVMDLPTRCWEAGRFLASPSPRRERHLVLRTGCHHSATMQAWEMELVLAPVPTWQAAPVRVSPQIRILPTVDRWLITRPPSPLPPGSRLAMLGATP